jgi:hypothetical protein
MNHFVHHNVLQKFRRLLGEFGIETNSTRAYREIIDLRAARDIQMSDYDGRRVAASQRTFRLWLHKSSEHAPAKYRRVLISADVPNRYCIIIESPAGDAYLVMF